MIDHLKDRSHIATNKKLTNSYDQFKRLLIVLRAQTLPAPLIKNINEEIAAVNAVTENDKELKKQLRKSQTSILSHVEKEENLVVKNHYTTKWTALGMAAFGLPLGSIIGLFTGNMGLLAIGLPIGLVIGTAYGAQLDKKASEEGRQLNIKLK